MKEIIIIAVVYIVIGVALGYIYSRAVPVFKTDMKRHCLSLPRDENVIYAFSKHDPSKAADALGVLKDVFSVQVLYSTLYALVCGEERSGILGENTIKGSGMFIAIPFCAMFSERAYVAIPLIASFCAAVLLFRKIGLPDDYTEDSSQDWSFPPLKYAGSNYDERSRLNTIHEIYEANRHFNLLDLRCKILISQANNSSPFRSLFWGLTGALCAFNLSLFH